MPAPITRRVVAATSAASVAGAAVPALPVLRFHMPNGLLEIQDAATAVRLLENEQRQRLAAEAEQAALSTVYCLSGEPDDSRPHGGLLTLRLNISERTAYELLRTGELRYTCAGKKNYRVSERAVREYLGDMPPT
jgi:excisionase family DNA binding protein